MRNDISPDIDLYILTLKLNLFYFLDDESIMFLIDVDFYGFLRFERECTITSDFCWDVDEEFIVEFSSSFCWSVYEFSFTFNHFVALIWCYMVSKHKNFRAPIW